jgi:UDP-N-acetylmuramate dehydrogenase
MADVVSVVDVYRLGERRAERVPAEGAGFAYRRTALSADAVVTGATLRLGAGDPAAIRAAMDEARAWRRRTQPLAEPNCGSVITNPPGRHAAQLIEEAGLKGAAIGGVRVSSKHANFIVAGEGARADDVRALIELIRRTVASRTGVELEPEVRLIGEFDRVGG